MIKIKHLVLLMVCAVTAFTACSKKEEADNFDAAAQFTKDTTAIRAFVVANKIPAIKDPKTGLFYQVITAAPGNFVYQTNSSVTVNYTGSVLGGAVFDTTNGKPITFDSLNQLILGWQIGIPLVQPGGRIRLFVPSGLGYGNRGGMPFPQNSNLDFTIDVISAK
ncbi:FKBP-type peptidyl-prolyl cis-trans isomerase [Pedobacter cryoconitis]|uniref:Peptidyl-prolyl cis-trans isomerase n=1 Tax=Pedobacter cryoconitis TaxID=188932 RepID=A0A7W9DYG3_9SPHI|nr:FKBP-type peptidyl-prolyl cis-trans isomerase [Pedobacter cryoconitis]MBB5634510.1 FKBP-type peptidyl-prolyl cis-trans isomerase [Pedobacter cryoconitis]MBB6272365.1 FKBP-type peptidyl-prolyl cis-trans isomerase [Pedobacter cryoconitis]